MTKQQIYQALESIRHRETFKRQRDIKWYESEIEKTEYESKRRQLEVNLNVAVLIGVITSDLINEIQSELMGVTE